MSTDACPAEAAAGAHTANPASSIETRRILRFSTGVTVAVAIAFAIDWPLNFLTPVLAAAFLSSPLPGMTPRRWMRSVFYVLAAVTLGTVFTLFLVPYPLLFVLGMGLSLFHLYYLLNRRGPVMFVLMAILAVLILPMMGTAHELLALAFAAYFALSASLAIVVFALAHWLFPEPDGGAAPAAPVFMAGYSAPGARAALKSTVAVLPLVILFVAAGLQAQLLVMVNAVLFSLIPDLSTGLAAGKKSLASTAIGCASAVVVYWLLVAVPEYHFLLALWFLAMLAFARIIFSDHPLGKYMGSAAIAMTILVSGSLDPDTDFVDKLVNRVVLICAATLYVVAAMAVVDRYLIGGGISNSR